MEPHTTTTRYGQFVRQVIDFGKVSKFLQDKVYPVYEPAAPFIRLVYQQFIELRHHKACNGIISGLFVRQDKEQCLLLFSDVCYVIIALMGNGVDRP